MLTAKLPYLDVKEDASGKLIKQRKEIEVDINMTIYAEERFERFFPELAKEYTLFGFIEQLQRSGGSVLQNLKAIFCFVENDAMLPTFKDFCQLFSFEDREILEELLQVLQNIFQKISEASMVSQKKY